ncbi:NADP-dependent phosphogluconate dehydrogenase [Dyadobacter frigoris]|uniref:6-phosphogluconate dehydrogenase, decarboxylating n=1 Tax=Dyadobacter frigoris TaxID=2576211 RepID=A0A4U6CZK3_9BACT|nr:NADP-dependent phosphogluconate dehydrogenase [Dyadobacter frigoris]TKT90279.1 NADP-dependent phosphogluconate dehydrogenase [Dyadobacter frigoris]GLU52514.1 6-phosphogluconate dehydrogenase, decarboxylating [Dyadobacter frigoris]
MSDQQKYNFGMIGLGTMGRNLLLNIGDHGFAGAGYDKDATKGTLLEEEGKDIKVKGFSDVKEFIASLTTPRAVMMLVPAGKIVDSVIEELLPLLDKGDILIDGGNSHFVDTNRRVDYLENLGYHFFGMGISGGEEGARRGPSIMPGGDKEAYSVMKPILESIAAKVDGAPCVTYIGQGSAGHFVKMVHNGIEYGLMQLISETYEILKTGLKLDDDSIQKLFEKWNEGRLQSFLIDITKDIFKYKAPGTDHLLLDDIKDEARAKGTGKWTSQAAMDLQSPIPTIDTAVAMRDLSKYKALREKAATLYSNAETAKLDVDQDAFLAELEEAFYFAMIITYAQGMQMLSNASVEYNYGLNLSEIAKIWRGGCIIRSAFLNDIYNAYEKDNELAHLLLDESVAKTVNETISGVRSVISTSVSSGIAVPAFAASLSYFDAFRSKRMPSNLIQAQRDFFGAHTYELIGKEGVFHTQWVPKN